MVRRLAVTVDDDLLDDLKTLASEKNTTIAALVRFALDEAFEGELDVVAGVRALDEVLSDPASTVSLAEYLASQGLDTP